MILVMQQSEGIAQKLTHANFSCKVQKIHL